MIDKTIELFDEVARCVLGAEPDALVSSTMEDASAHFPFVSFEETSNTLYEPCQDSSCGEVAATLAYTLNVFAVGDDRASEARRLAAAVCDLMTRRNFTRVFYGPVDNSADPSVYRVTARFVAVADRNNYYRR